MPISDDPMHIDNVRARRAADGAEQDMFRDIAREIDGPPPGIGTLLKRALTDNRPYLCKCPAGLCRCEHAEGGADRG